MNDPLFEFDLIKTILFENINFESVCGVDRPEQGDHNGKWKMMSKWPCSLSTSLLLLSSFLATLIVIKWGCASQSTNAESGWPAHPPLLWPRGLLYFTINEVWRYFWFFGPYRPVQGPKCLILRNLWFWSGLTFCLIALAFVDQSFWKFQGFQSIYWAIERVFKDF